jgi:microcystin-dependent protein
MPSQAAALILTHDNSEAPLGATQDNLPLETASFISDLNTSNPAHTDGLSQADSHMRLIKSTIQATFPNFTDVALASTQAQLDAAVAVSAGTVAAPFPLGTAALPGLFPLGNPNTGIFSPAANQIAVSLNGVQALLMGGTALVTSLGVSAAAFTTTGAYSGGTGQLVPIGAVLEWYDDVLPTEGGYCWANGQIIASANTVCPILLARWGSRFGGNGTTTMGVPDRRDTVGVGKSTMGGVAARSLLTAFWTAVGLGGLFGSAGNTLGVGNLPPYTPIGTVTPNAGGTSPLAVAAGSGVTTVSDAPGGGAFSVYGNGTFNTLTTPFVGNPQGGVSTPVNNVQPSTTCNYIIRIG